MPTIVPIDPTAKKRDTQYICVCPNCQCERVISYSQQWNIVSGNTAIQCRPCRIELGLQIMNLDGLKKGRGKYHPRKKKYRSNPSMAYHNLFNGISEETRKKQSLAKKGKTGEAANNWKGGNTPEILQKRKEQAKQYRKKRLKEDKAFYVMKIARNRVSEFVRKKGAIKQSRKLGCTYEVFKAHIEAQFKPGMTWDNFGLWHIDHIFPLSVALELGQDTFKKACHYTNLQPLWAKENIQKGNKVPYGISL